MQISNSLINRCWSSEDSLIRVQSTGQVLFREHDCDEVVKLFSTWARWQCEDGRGDLVPIPPSNSDFANLDALEADLAKGVNPIKPILAIEENGVPIWEAIDLDDCEE